MYPASKSSNDPSCVLVGGVGHDVKPLTSKLEKLLESLVPFEGESASNVDANDMNIGLLAMVV